MLSFAESKRAFKVFFFSIALEASIPLSMTKYVVSQETFYFSIFFAFGNFDLLVKNL